MIKATITIKGNLALVKTEQGQTALIALNALCKFLQQNNIQPINIDLCQNK